VDLRETLVRTTTQQIKEDVPSERKTAFRLCKWRCRNFEVEGQEASNVKAAVPRLPNDPMQSAAGSTAGMLVGLI